MSAAGPLTLRVGIVLCLLLAAIILGADSGEYPALTAAGMQALVRGPMPLLAIAALHLFALDSPAWLRPQHRFGVTLVALGCDVVLGLGAARLLRRFDTPVFAIALVVAIVLAVGTWSLLRRQGLPR